MSISPKTASVRRRLVVTDDTTVKATMLGGEGMLGAEALLMGAPWNQQKPSSTCRYGHGDEQR
jgi:hypothetical protein